LQRKPANVRHRRAVSAGEFLGRRSRLPIPTNGLRGGAAHGPTSMRTAMRISARNQIKGTVVDVKKGATRRMSASISEAARS
jgi:hypothetical protein